jgi:hypothetical protein
MKFIYTSPQGAVTQNTRIVLHFLQSSNQLYIWNIFRNVFHSAALQTSQKSVPLCIKFRLISLFAIALKHFKKLEHFAFSDTHASENEGKF